MGTTPDPVASPTPPTTGWEASNTDSFATKSELDALATRVDALEQKGTQVPGGAPEPNNPGENLSPTPTNPELEPHQPGVGPEDAVPTTPATNAPTTTDPEGDTSVQNAPQPPAPEPEGANVTTNPGTSTDNGQGQSQVETPDPEGAVSGQGDTSATPSEPQPTQPATEATDDTLYVYVGEDPSFTWPAGYVKSDLETPDGKPLYRFTDDVVGQPAVGAVDGTIGIYAAEVLVPTPEGDAAAS